MRLDDLSAFIERQPRWLVALGTLGVHGILYMLPNQLRLYAARELPMTPIDRAVPFWPLTTWVYWSDYVLVFVAFRGCREGTAARFVYAVLTLVALGTAVHWLYPTVYPRGLFPLPDDSPSWTVSLLKEFREVDSPASCLPSLHVAASYLAAFVVYAHNRRLGRWLLLWATAIFAATLTTKQHYFVDGLAGLALASAVWLGWYGRGVRAGAVN